MLNNYPLLLKNTWFRLILLALITISVLTISSRMIHRIFNAPIEKKISNANRGLSSFEGELSSLDRQVKAIEKKINERSKNSNGQYQHYYNLYLNPVRYINQFVLNQAKPEGLLITTSSVMPNTSISSIERAKMSPLLKKYGISRVQNLTKIFSITRVSLSAVGSFPMIGLYLSNLNELPIKFSIRSFDLKESNNTLTLSLEMAFIVYRMQDD
jgi:hypothetical protein